MWSEKNLNDRDWRPLKSLVKTNGNKSTVELLAMFNSESKHFHMHNVKRTQVIGIKQLCSPKKTTYQ